MAVALDGRKRFRGILHRGYGRGRELRRKDAAEGEAADVLLPIADMAEARLVLPTRWSPSCYAAARNARTQLE